MENQSFDIAIIGGGPAGVNAALKASKLGKKVALFEESALGGTCLNRGCVPTKTLLKSAETYLQIKNSSEFGIDVENVKIDYLKIYERSKQVSLKILAGLNFALKKSSVEVINARAKIISAKEIQFDLNGEKSSIFAKNILIASGSKPKIFKDLHCSCENFLDSTSALNLKTLPKSVTILGAGAIGVEFAQIWGALGSKVSLVEFKNQILPLADEDAAKSLTRIISKQNVEIFTSAKAKSCSICDGGIETVIELADASTKNLKSEYVLCALGVSANTEDLFDKNLNIELEKGFIKIDDNFETSIKNIFACGDVSGKNMLAHWAEWEAEKAIDAIFLDKKTSVKLPCPACVYSLTPAAWIGESEKSLKNDLDKYLVSKVSHISNAKAQADSATSGFVKIISEKQTGKIVGASILGEGACELISILSIAISEKITRETLSKIIFPHPSLSELVKGACKD